MEIICVNPWKNRLIGEARLPGNERKTVLNNLRMKTSEFARMELIEAGLLGPVRIVPSVMKGVEF